MDSKPGLCYRKHTGCEPFDDEDCRDCPHVNEWPEDWDQAVESWEERYGGSE